jgi:hypothetical protein
MGKEDRGWKGRRGKKGEGTRGCVEVGIKLSRQERWEVGESWTSCCLLMLGSRPASSRPLFGQARSPPSVQTRRPGGGDQQQCNTAGIFTAIQASSDRDSHLTVSNRLEHSGKAVGPVLRNGKTDTRELKPSPQSRLSQVVQERCKSETSVRPPISTGIHSARTLLLKNLPSEHRAITAIACNIIAVTSYEQVLLS